MDGVDALGSTPVVTTDDAAGESAEEQQHEGRQRSGLSKKKLMRIKEQADKRGVIYISRIPPHMKPQKLRTLLEPFGTIGRVYLAPEDPGARRQRKKKGTNSGKNFTEGWVEFEDKRRAKRAVLMLNGQPIGGKHRSAHHFDLWCMKYLPKFKWDHLTEQIRYDKAVREQKLVAELSAAKRERDFYLSRVDRAKAVNAISERKKRKAGQESEGELGHADKSDVLALQAPPELEHDDAARASGIKKRKLQSNGSEVGVKMKSLKHDGKGVVSETTGEKRDVRREFQQHGKVINRMKGEGAPALPDDLLALVAPKRK